MFNFRPNTGLPGFRVGVAEEDPGFRINTDGSVGPTLPSTSNAAVFAYDPYGNALQTAAPTPFSSVGMSYNAGSGLYPTPYRPYDPVAGRQPSQDPLLDQSDRTAKLYAGVGGNPFSFLDWQRVNTNPMTPIGDGSSSPYVAYGDGARNGPGGTPPLDPDSVRPAGMAPFALSRPSLLSFVGAGRGDSLSGAMLHPSFPGRAVPAEELPLDSFDRTASPRPMSAVRLPLSSVDGPLPGEGFWKVDTGPRGVATPGALPAPDQRVDPNIVRIADGEPATDDDIQVAQQQGAPRRPPARQPGGGAGNRPETPQPRPMPEPGRGYLTRSVEEIERGMTPLQIQINRDQAFRELTRQPLTAVQARSALPDDWESTKPADLVDEIKRAAERHGVPIQMFARQLYQEGKFNERDKLARPLIMDSDKGNVPLGYAQMDKNTLQTLKNLARLRGDTNRSRELATYSLANREQAFDAAAEQLAYLYRLTGGSWPKALAAYNFGPGLANWFNGEPVSISKTGEPVYPSNDKWKEIAAYLAYALRGASEDPQTADSYVYRPPNEGRARERLYRPAVPSDTRLNP